MIRLYLIVFLLIASVIDICNCAIEPFKPQQHQHSLQYPSDSGASSLLTFEYSYPSYHNLGIYLDSLPYHMIPKCLHKYHYKRMNKVSMIHIIDTINHSSIVEGKSSNVKDGFLSINASITRVIKDSSSVDSCFLVSYIVNHNEVKTKRDVKSLVQLKESEIMFLEIVFNRVQKKITALIITDKTGHKRKRTGLENNQ